MKPTARLVADDEIDSRLTSWSGATSEPNKMCIWMGRKGRNQNNSESAVQMKLPIARGL